MAKKQKEEKGRRIVNRKARHEFEILETFEAGIALTGSEVKSLRAGACQLSEAFVRIHGYEVTLYNCQIDRYTHAGPLNHDPLRKRRLLLHRREIIKLTPKLNQAGATLVVLSLYFNKRGLAKVELGLGTGKKHYDKREDLKKKDHKRDMDRAMSRRR